MACLNDVLTRLLTRLNGCVNELRVHHWRPER